MKLRLWLAAVLLGAAAAAAAAESRPRLWAAAGKADVTPDLKRETIWLAGYGAKGRRAQGVRDPLYARALVVSDGERTVALVSVDSIGIYREDVQEIRRRLRWEGGRSYLFLTATHNHSTPDTLGLWGRLPGASGVDRRYHRRLKSAIVRLVRELSGRLAEAELAAASARVDPKGLCLDHRDPVVIDPALHAFQLRARGGKGGVIATVVRWSCHAEVMSSRNLFVTADYPGRLCGRVEETAGGTCLFVPGVIGGLLSPQVDRSGGVEAEFAEAGRVGETVADKALEALRSRADRAAVGTVSFASRTVRLPVENSRYLFFLRSLAFGHKLLDKDGRRLGWLRTRWLPLRHLALFPLPERLRPWVETEVSRVRLGPVDILGVPGELFPELAIGGYDGRYRFHYPLVDPTNENPPDLGRAPKPPYLADKLKSRHGLIVGLANDEIGYIVPAYDFKAAPTRSMTPKPPGHPNEETNSIGPSATGLLLKAFDELLASP